MAESFLSQIGDFTLIDCSHSPLNGVIFHNVQTLYSADEAIKCIYSITESIEPEDGDIIGLFKVGWVSSSEVYSYVGAKLPVNKERTFLHTVFEDNQLPCDSADLYQFCYVTKSGGVVGASTPFSFESNDIIAVEDPADPGLLVFKSRVSQLKDELLKLSDEKSYYASKYEVLNDNFIKLKQEFDKLELELNSEREVAKQLEEANMLLTNKSTGQLKIKNNDSKPNEVLKPVEDDIICADTEDSKFNNSEVWKSLYEIYEVVVEVNRSLKSNDDDKLSYQDLTEYILEVFTETKKKFQLNDKEKVDKSKYCSCYFQQKAFSCPKLCSEAHFEYMMNQPLYTCFSNFDHYNDDSDNCDGRFDPDVLKDYIQAVSQRPVYTRNNSELNQNLNSVNASSVNINEPQLNDSDKLINDERDQAIRDLKVAREKIAALVSRVDVLELELVAQKSNQISKVDGFTVNKSKCAVSSSLKSSDIENILESVNSEYINLKGKYNELSKRVAKSDSIETRCAQLEEENKKLISYFTEERGDNKHHVLPSGQFCGDLGNLIVEKQKAQNELIKLQKESVGKISVNLIRRENQAQDN